MTQLTTNSVVNMGELMECLGITTVSSLLAFIITVIAPENSIGTVFQEYNF